MSFLTPLYLLAGLTVALPVLFHLIRRTPRGRQEFSSLMFLRPSPPKVTKRSRIEDWLLLLLRGLAVCLMVLAFSRPFWRAQADTSLAEVEVRRWAILLDTSASMKREGFWDQAQLRLHEVLSETRPQDIVSVSAFDRRVTPVVTAEEWSSHPAVNRVNLVMNRFKDVKPQWQPTSLATAVMSATEQLDDQTDKQLAEQVVIVISDLQQGSGWEGLREYPWPDAVTMRLEQVGRGLLRSNATVQAVVSDQPVDDILRLRASNAADSKQETFRISGFPAGNLTQVREADDVFVTAEASVYVPPGQSRVVRAPAGKDISQQAGNMNNSPEAKTAATDSSLPAGSEKLAGHEAELITAWVLSGDDDVFDNVCFVTPSTPWQVRVLYLGEDSVTDPKGVRFFLGPALPSDARRSVSISDLKAASPVDEVTKQLTETTALIISGQVPGEIMDPLKEWVLQGGLVFFVSTSAEQAGQLYELTNVPPGRIEEATVNRYAMVSAPELKHPVLAPFADPRFSDFTRLKVWHYRDVDLQPFEKSTVLLRFDSGSPALIEIPLGKGRLMVFTTSWRRDDSELAVWSKFVPLMNGLLEYGARQPVARLQFETGEQVVPLTDDAGQFRVLSSTGSQDLPASEENQTACVIRLPDGQVHSFSMEKPVTLLEPGIYVAAPDEESLETSPQLFAVNLAAEESRTDALNPELLESTGIKMAVTSGSEKVAATELRERQLLNYELEARQQIWRWMLVGALSLILLESALSGRITRKRLSEQPA